MTTIVRGGPWSGEGRAVAEDLVELDRVVEDDEVRTGAGLEAAEVGAAGHAGGRFGGGAEGGGGRDAEGVGAAARIQHREGRAGEGAVGGADRAVLRADRDGATEGVSAVGGAGGGDRVADQDRALGGGAPGGADGVVGEVPAVDDQGDEDVVAAEGRVG